MLTAHQQVPVCVLLKYIREYKPRNPRILPLKWCASLRNVINIFRPFLASIGSSCIFEELYCLKNIWQSGFEKDESKQYWNWEGFLDSFFFFFFFSLSGKRFCHFLLQLPTEMSRRVQAPSGLCSGSILIKRVTPGLFVTKNDLHFHASFSYLAQLCFTSPEWSGG